jgi:ankyrin repeat protein
VLGRLGCDLHTRDSKGSGLLHMCTSSTMVDALVDCGLDPRDRNDAGFTPLHLVSHIGAAKALLEHGAEINDLNNARSTPLHFVEGPRMARFLLSHGANPNAVNSYSHSPMHLISTKGMWEVVWCLLHAGSDPHIRGRDGKDAEQLAREVLNTVLPTDEAEGSRERRRLEQTIELLNTWDKCVQFEKVVCLFVCFLLRCAS